MEAEIIVLTGANNGIGLALIQALVAESKRLLLSTCPLRTLPRMLTKRRMPAGFTRGTSPTCRPHWACLPTATFPISWAHRW